MAVRGLGVGRSVRSVGNDVGDDGEDARRGRAVAKVRGGRWKGARVWDLRSPGWSVATSTE